MHIIMSRYEGLPCYNVTFNPGKKMQYLIYAYYNVTFNPSNKRHIHTKSRTTYHL
jgi:hypothetical protein